MTRIYFDAATGTLVIDAWSVSFPAGGLACALDATGLVVVSTTPGGFAVVSAAYTALGREDGSGFTSVADCLAYLEGEFAKRRQGTEAAVALVAGVPIGGQRIVSLGSDGTAQIATSDALDGADDVVGLSTGAASAGASVLIATGDEIDDPSWSFTPGPVWLGPAGALTQIVPQLPDAVVRLQIGIALSATRLLMSLGTPVYLA